MEIILWTIFKMIDYFFVSAKVFINFVAIFHIL